MERGDSGMAAERNGSGNGLGQLEVGQDGPVDSLLLRRETRRSDGTLFSRGLLRPLLVAPG